MDCSTFEIERYLESVRNNQQYGEHEDVIPYHYRKIAYWYFNHGQIVKAIELLEVAQNKTNKQFFLVDWCYGEILLADINSQFGNELSTQKHLDGVFSTAGKISDAKTRVSMQLFVLEKMAMFLDKSKVAAKGLQMAQQVKTANVPFCDIQKLSVLKAYFQLYNGAQEQALVTIKNISPDIRSLTSALAVIYARICMDAKLYPSAMTALKHQKEHVSTFPLATRFEFYSTFGHLNSKLKKDVLAVDYYRRAISTLEEIRSQTYDVDKLSYLSQYYNKLCGDAIRSAFATRDYDSAFFFMDGAKSRILRDALGGGALSKSRDFNKNASQMIEIQDKINRLKAFKSNSLVVNRFRGFSVKPSSYARNNALLDEELRKLQIEYSKIYSHIEKDIPFGVRNRFKPAADLRDIQNSLHSNDVVIEYFMGDNSVYTMLIKPDEVICKIKPYDKKLFETCVDSVNFILSADLQIQHGSNKVLHEKLHALYKLFFEYLDPHLSVDSTICLVKDGYLNYLPFALLWSPEQGYLVERYSLYSCPSASIMKLLRDRPNADSMTAAAFAAPSLIKWPELPASAAEADVFMQLFPNAKAFKREKATLYNFLNIAGKSDLILISSHGRNSANPMLSHIVFSGGTNGADKMLKASDIMLLRIPAKLVFLNCCSTAVAAEYTGTVNKSGDFFGLPQAFLSAGADSVICSGIPLNDRLAAKFSIVFHRKLLKQNKTILTALRETQISFIKQKKLPSAWAGYMLIGKAE